MRRFSAKFWWITGSTVAIVMALAVALLLFNNHYVARAAPRTSVGDMNVAGQTRDEVKANLQARADQVTVDITVEGKATPAKLSDLGYSVDIDNTVDRVFDTGDTFLGRLVSLVKPATVEPVVKQDAKATEAFVKDLSDSIGGQASDAVVNLDEGKGVFSVTPASEGKTIDSGELNSTAKAAALKLDSNGVELKTVKMAPKVTTEEAEKVTSKANEIVALPVTVSGGVTSHEATASEKASWISLFSDDGALTEPKIDAKSVAAWVKATGESTNDKPIPGVRNVNSRGDVVSVVSQTVSGWEVEDTSKLATDLVKALEEGRSFDGKFDYKEVESTEWEEQKIADGAENLVYQAAPGEKWIHVNLSNYTLSAYEGATIVQGPIPIVAGAPLTPTVTGNFSVYSKLPSQTMRGNNTDGTTYETPGVPDVLYFHADYAIHGAYWRSSFGYAGEGGSHGCVNMPLDAASTLYNWAGIGTKVIVGY